MNAMKERTGIKVGDIMTRNFVSVKPDASLLKCAKEMSKKRVGSLLLKADGKARGIVTERDIIWAITKTRARIENIKASDVASKRLVSVRPSADLFDALRKMKKADHWRLPVMEKGGVVGIITIKDILRLQPGLIEMVNDSINIREESKKFKRLSELARGGVIAKGQGICEECGNVDLLYRVDGRLVCEGCMD